MLLATALALFLCFGILGLGAGYFLIQESAQPEPTIDVSDYPAPTPAPILLKNFEYLPEQIDCIALTADGKSLAAGCRDGTVKLWDVASGQELASLMCPEKEVHSVAFSPDGKLLASGSRGRGWLAQQRSAMGPDASSPSSWKRFTEEGCACLCDRARLCE